MKRLALAAVVLGVAASPALAQPEISTMLPAAAHEGCSVSIIGTGFSTAPDVSFNGTPATVALALPSLIICDVPAGATSGPVTVTVAGGTSNGFTFTVVPDGPPAITAVLPLLGPVGSPIQVVGTNLGSFWCGTGSVQVLFDGVAAPWCVPFESGVFTFVPAVAPGFRAVTVAVDGVASNTAWFLVTGTLPSPTLDAITPASGPARTVVTLTGTDFVYSTGSSFGYPTVLFGTTQVVPLVVSSTSITLCTPSTLPIGPLDVTVRVYDVPSLNYVDSNAVTWTVTPFTGTPFITSATAAGTAGSYGSWYTITGSGFLAAGSEGIVLPKLFVNGQEAWVYYAADNLALAFLFAPTPSSGTLYIETAGTASNTVPFTIP